MTLLRLLIVLWIPVAAFAAAAADLKLTPAMMQQATQQAGASCDANAAYAYLRGRTVAHYKASITKLDPEFACRLAAFFKEANCGQIFSGVRSYADWQRTYRQNGGKGVNSFASSCHTYGLAVDVYGCYGKRHLMAKHKIHFPYNEKHIQCVEHPAPKCSAQSQTCAGGPGRGTVAGVASQYGGGAPIGSDAPMGDSGQASSGGGAPGSGGSPSGGGSGSGSGSGQQSATTPTQGDPSLYNRYDDSYGIWGELGTAFKQTSVNATLTCAPSTLNLGSKALIEWDCGSGATGSKGGTSRKAAAFKTAGLTEGKGYAKPTKTTSYKLLCLSGDQVISEDTCTVRVSEGAAGSTDGKTLIELYAQESDVTWGGETTVIWATIGTQACRVKGGGQTRVGTAGSLETGRLFRSTTYVLECETPQGTQAKQIEIEVL